MHFLQNVDGGLIPVPPMVVVKIEIPNQLSFGTEGPALEKTVRSLVESKNRAGLMEGVENMRGAVLKL